LARGTPFGRSQHLVVVHLYSGPPFSPPAIYAAKEKRATVSAAHPLQARPVRVEERIPWKAADVVEAPVGTPVLDQWGAGPLADAPGGLPAPRAILAGPEARPVAAGALLALVPEALNQLRGLFLRGTRYTLVDHEVSSRGPGLGVLPTPPGPSLFLTPSL
jgi:hypothetical protein